MLLQIETHLLCQMNDDSFLDCLIIDCEVKYCAHYEESFVKNFCNGGGNTMGCKCAHAEMIS